VKPRLPVVGDAGERRSDRPQPRAPEPAQRVAVDRIAIGVGDRDAPELALRFAAKLIAALAEHGRRVAALLATQGGRTREGDAQRLRKAGAEPAVAIADSELPLAAQRALAALPADCVVVAVGNGFIAHLTTALAVRVSSSPARFVYAEVGERFGGDASVDLELGPGMEGSATLIGDWLAARVP
jgi:hypothetical protein